MMMVVGLMITDTYYVHHTNHYYYYYTILLHHKPGKKNATTPNRRRTCADRPCLILFVRCSWKVRGDHTGGKVSTKLHVFAHACFHHDGQPLTLSFLGS